MKKILFLMILSVFTISCSATSGLVQKKSNYNVKNTADRLVDTLKKKKLIVFNRVDHAKNAKGVNLPLKDTELVIFGNPNIGTKLMHCNRSVAIDLPQKMLIWEDDQGITWLAYNDPMYLMQRHQLQKCKAHLTKVSGVLDKLSDKAVK